MATFDDVPPGNPFYHDIEAVVAAIPEIAAAPFFLPDEEIGVPDVDWCLVKARHWQDATRPDGDVRIPALAADVPVTHPDFPWIQTAIKAGIHGGPERPDFDPGYVLNASGASPGTGKSIVLDGSTWINFGTAGLGAVGDYTVTIWIRTAIVDGRNMRVWLAGNEASFPSLRQVDQTIVHLGANHYGGFHEAWYGDDSYAAQPCTDTVSTDTWRLLIAKRAGDVMYNYVDGVLQTYGPFRSDALDLTGILQVGNYAGYAEPYTGKLGEMRFYTRSLTGQELVDLYNGSAVDATGLVLSVPFDEGAGQTFADDSGSGNNGATVAGAVTWDLTDGPPISGTPPGLTMTRAMAVTFLVRALGALPLESATARFGDVAIGSQYYGYVERAAALSIIGIRRAANFQPDIAITRAKFFAFVRRGFGIPFVTTPGAPTEE